MLFNIFGHPNIKATHRNTIEFTRDTSLSEEGDCIIGVGADFRPDELKEILKFSRIQITISVDNLKEEIKALVNKEFDDAHEIVIRRSEFASKRTLGIRADRAAIDFDRKLVETLKNPAARAVVEIIGI
jgi:uncharacterized protein